MQTEIATSNMRESNASPALEMHCIDSSDVLSSYDGSKVVYRILRIETWGSALLNLGFYPFSRPMAFLNLFSNAEQSLQRLVRKSLDLLDIGRDHHVLDIACGRGESSFIAQCMFPDSTVVGIDLLEDHVHVARTLFNRVDHLSYQIGNAEQLEFADGSIDRIMCLEAAFHFPDRAEFLHECYRVLRPGGRLVVVDFAWNTDADRARRDEAEIRLVRDIWQWDDFFSIADYENVASEAGFEISSRHDWSHHVTLPVQKRFECLSLFGNSSWGRKLLEWRNPLYRSLSNEDWKNVAQAVRAHKRVQECSKYMAFVFEKSLVLERALGRNQALKSHVNIGVSC